MALLIIRTCLILLTLVITPIISSCGDASDIPDTDEFQKELNERLENPDLSPMEDVEFEDVEQGTSN